MTTIRVPTHEDLLNLQHCVDGVSDLPAVGNWMEWNRYARVAVAPGKKIVGYVCAHAYYDLKWETTAGCINKTCISRLYEDTSVIADLVSGVENQLKEGYYDMKADVPMSSTKTIDAYIRLGYREDPLVERADMSIMELRKKHINEAQEVLAVAEPGPEPGAGAADNFDADHVPNDQLPEAGAADINAVQVPNPNDHLPEAGAEDRANVPLSKSQKRRQRRKRAVHVPNDHLPEAGAEDRANVPLSKSQKRRQRRKIAGAALPSTVHTDADAVAVLKDRVTDVGAVLANRVPSEVTIPWCDNFSQCGAAVEDIANEKLIKSQIEEDEEEQRQQQQQQ